MPKAKGDPYFISCRKGAEEAANELGVELLWDGPTDLDPAKQNEVVEAWITRGVDVDRRQRREQRGHLDRSEEGAQRKVSRSLPGMPTPKKMRAISLSIRPLRKASAKLLPMKPRGSWAAKVNLPSLLRA